MSSSLNGSLSLLIAATLLVAAIDGHAEPIESAARHSAGAFSFSFTAHTGFQPDLCDCPVNPLGGWAERAAVFDSLASAGAVDARFDAGGWLSDDTHPGAAALCHKCRQR